MTGFDLFVFLSLDMNQFEPQDMVIVDTAVGVEHFGRSLDGRVIISCVWWTRLLNPS
jgi:hypothetical protein